MIGEVLIDCGSFLFLASPEEFACQGELSQCGNLPVSITTGFLQGINSRGRVSEQRFTDPHMVTRNADGFWPREHPVLQDNGVELFPRRLVLFGCGRERLRVSAQSAGRGRSNIGLESPQGGSELDIGAGLLLVEVILQSPRQA